MQDIFELYLEAMQQLGANTRPIQAFLCKLTEGHTLQQAAAEIQLPLSIQRFVQTTFSFFNQETPVLAAAFVYGREAITPLMFTPLVRRLEHTLPVADRKQLETLIYYLQRHIELDQGGHFPQALCMLMCLAREESHHWQMIETAAQTALLARLDFLTTMEAAIGNQPLFSHSLKEL